MVVFEDGATREVLVTPMDRWIGFRPVDLGEIRRMYEDGMTCLEISSVLGCHMTTAWRMVRESGAAKRPRIGRSGNLRREEAAVLRNGGLTFSQVGEAMGITRQCAFSYYAEWKKDQGK